MAKADNIELYSYSFPVTQITKINFLEKQLIRGSDKLKKLY